MRDAKRECTIQPPVAAPGAIPASLVCVDGDEAKMKVLELMADSLHGHVAEGIRPSPPTVAPKRVPRGSLGAAARTVRRSPTPAATVATVNRTLANVNNRIVALLTRSPANQLGGPERVELALLTRLHRSLSSHAASVVNDAVLCDSIAEFVDHVPPVLADLEAGGARRLRRLIDYDRELLAEVAALGGQACSAELKPRLRQARDVLDGLLRRQDGGEGDTEASLRPVAAGAVEAYQRLNLELDRRARRQQPSMLDTLTRA